MAVRRSGQKEEGCEGRRRPRPQSQKKSKKAPKRPAAEERKGRRQKGSHKEKTMGGATRASREFPEDQSGFVARQPRFPPWAKQRKRLWTAPGR